MIGEPPDVGLAPTGVWRVPAQSPIVIGGPFPQAKPLPSSQTPSLPALSFPLPPPPWLFLQGSGWGQSRLVRGRGLRAQGGGWGGGGLQAALGARPTSGGTRLIGGEIGWKFGWEFLDLQGKRAQEQFDYRKIAEHFRKRFRNRNRERGNRALVIVL